MAYSYSRVRADGVTSRFSIPFDVPSGSSVAVRASGTIGPWRVQSGEVVFNTPPQAGVVLVIYRETSRSLPHEFNRGSAFTAANLDEDLKHLLNIALEAREAASGFPIQDWLSRGVADTLYASIDMVNQLRVTINGYSGTMQTLSDRMAQLSNLVGGYNNRITILEAKVSSQDSRLTSQSSILSSQSTRIDGLQARVQALESRPNTGGGGGGGGAPAPTPLPANLVRWNETYTGDAGAQGYYSIGARRVRISAERMYLNGEHIIELANRPVLDATRWRSSDLARAPANELVAVSDIIGGVPYLSGLFRENLKADFDKIEANRTLTESLESRIAALEAAATNPGGGGGTPPDADGYVRIPKYNPTAPEIDYANVKPEDSWYDGVEVDRWARPVIRPRAWQGVVSSDYTASTGNDPGNAGNADDLHIPTQSSIKARPVTEKYFSFPDVQRHGGFGSWYIARNFARHSVDPVPTVTTGTAMDSWKAAVTLTGGIQDALGIAEWFIQTLLVPGIASVAPLDSPVLNNLFWLHEGTNEPVVSPVVLGLAVCSHALMPHVIGSARSSDYSMGSAGVCGVMMSTGSQVSVIVVNRRPTPIQFSVNCTRRAHGGTQTVYYPANCRHVSAQSQYWANKSNSYDLQMVKTYQPAKITPAGTAVQLQAPPRSVISMRF